jgi:hypothetical protein
LIGLFVGPGSGPVFLGSKPADGASLGIFPAMTSLLPQNPRIDAAKTADKKHCLAS